MVGSRQAEHESQGELMEEDDLVIRVGNSLGTERDKPIRRERAKRSLTPSPGRVIYKKVIAK